MTTREENEIADDAINQLFVTDEEKTTDRTLVDNSADPEQVALSESRVRTRKQQERNDIIWMLKDPRGRRILWKYLGECHTPHGLGFISDAGRLQYLSGQRDIGTKIYLDILAADITAFPKMMQEFKGDTNAKRKTKRDTGR